ncbi:unnamed protein product [Clavelina lepadiformis]|uniref:Hydantoinase A/oxoprolinase domain-containing protein n=1 Tax=Clavelina lepadiformis TaxID=159417 RepID=A0ABP0FRA4_CLALP
MFVVGPKYASAHPGPTYYRKGDPLTVTDINLFVGRFNLLHLCACCANVLLQVITSQTCIITSIRDIFQNYLTQIRTSVWMLMPPGKCLKNYEMKLIILSRFSSETLAVTF